MILEIQVANGNDDTWYEATVPGWNVALAYIQAGYQNSTFKATSSAMRFQSITIARGSTILYAYISVYSQAAQTSSEVNTRLRCELNANASAFSTEADFVARTWTTNSTYWDSIDSWALNTWYDSRNIDSCIQEVINLPTWASGNSIVVLWDDWEQRSTQSSFTDRQAASYDGTALYAPKLTIIYATPPELPHKMMTIIDDVI